MKLLSTILLVFFAGIPVVASATEKDKEKDKTIETSRDFSLRCRDVAEENSPEKRIAVTVHAKYSSKDQDIKINITYKTDDDLHKPFILNYPLDFEVFRQRFDSLLNERKDESLFVYYGSHLDVFYWIVTITEESTIPLAGILTTSQYVMVSSSDERHKTHHERAQTIKKQIDSLELVQINQVAISKKLELQKENKKINEALKNEHKQAAFEQLIKEYPKLKESTKDKNGNYNIDSLLKAHPIIQGDIEEDLTEADLTLKEQNKKVANLHIRRVSHVHYQFEKGYLERIQVYIESPETENLEVFENSYPIGFSSISNYRNFTDTRLYRRSNKFDGDVKDNYIFLSDIIKLYENQLNIATRDYSPGDTTLIVYPSSDPISRLNKQRNFYIIDGKTFTDVTGLSENSPNGLVQVELCRRFNLWTHRLQVHGSNNYGFVNYVIAKVNFSKIENKLKGLPLRNQLIVENNSIVSPSYATNLDYLRYENLGATFDLNLFLFDAPDFKYTFFLDAGLHYGHTPIIDSNYQLNQGGIVSAQNPSDLDAHNFTIFPRAKVQLFAERRYGLSLSYQANYTWLFTNNRFKQVMSYSGKGQDLNTLSTNKLAHWSHMIEAAFYIDVNPTSSTGKIFTTARFFFQQGDVNTFYPQILLGYAFNIFN